MGNKADIRGKSLDQFKAAHDKSFIIEKRLKDALAELGEGWLYESELMRSARIGPGEITRLREKFAKFTLIVGRRGKQKHVWAGTPALAKKLRSMAQEAA